MMGGMNEIINAWKTVHLRTEEAELISASTELLSILKMGSSWLGQLNWNSFLILTSAFFVPKLLLKNMYEYYLSAIALTEKAIS